MPGAQTLARRTSSVSAGGTQKLRCGHDGQSIALSAKRQRPPETFQAPPLRSRDPSSTPFLSLPPPAGSKYSFQVSGKYQPAAAGRTYAGIVEERSKHAFTSSGWLCRDGNGTAACQPCGQAKLRPCADCNDGAGREGLLAQSMI